MQLTWSLLLNSSTADIHRCARDANQPKEILLYAQILSSYLQGDTEKLASLCATLKPEDTLHSLAHLRLALRTGDLKEKTLHALAQEKTFGDARDADLQFCLGTAWGALGNNQMAMAAFTQACALYHQYAVDSKALRAQINAVSAESLFKPHKNFISEYQAIIEESKRIGERCCRGAAGVMLAREYQIVGLFDKAFEMIEESLKDLEAERGTSHYFHALLQKAHLLIDLKRESEVPPILKECELADFPPMRAARTLLAVALDPSLTWDLKLEADLLPTWKNRVPVLLAQRQVVEGSPAATELERTLLRLAYNGPVEKWDLITKLYPGESDSQLLENRFKNLIARVRKKHPDILQCQGSRYFLAKMPEKEGTL